MKPFLKWAGGKYKIIDRIRSSLPEGGRLIEPFVGSGAVFLNTDYSEYILADENADLINLYNCTKENHKKLLRLCESLFVQENNEEHAFYRLREDFNCERDVYKKSALFIYLNRHCFNGLCRYNSRGNFNVPFGRYKSPSIPREELIFFSEKSKDSVFLRQDFRKTMQMAKMGDVVYCDPPYVPLSETSNFTSYVKGGFSMQDQQDLADIAADLMQKGVAVIISNHDTCFTREAYKKASIEAFNVQRYISSDSKNRGAAAEIIASFME